MITGTIYDAATQETIPGANLVWLNVDGEFSGSGTASDANGNFTLPSAPIGCGTFRVSCLGYKSEIVTPSSVFFDTVTVQLTEDITTLPEVEIFGQRTTGSSNSSMVYAGLGLLALGILFFTFRK